VANIYRRERRHHRLDETVRAIKFVGTSFACGEFASAINTVSGRCSVTNPDERPASSIDRKSKGSPSSEVQPTPRYARFVRTICGSTRAQIKASATRKSAAPIPEHLTDILERFPSLSRRIYSFCQHVTDVAELVGLLDRFVKTVKTATEDQLFWIAKMCEDYLQGMPLCSKLLLHVYEHPAATTIVQASPWDQRVEVRVPRHQGRAPQGKLRLARMGVDCRVNLYAESEAESDAEVRRQSQPDEQHRRRGRNERMMCGSAAGAPEVSEQLGNKSAKISGKTDE
jgi:hypothetical protein